MLARAPHANHLHTERLQCIRADELIFSDIEIAVAGGEVLQVLGPNGSGKTSLLRILCGLALPSAGTVRWNGAEIQAQAGDYRRRLCYLGHLNGVANALTARENLRFALALGVARSDADPERALMRAGLAELAGIPARRLSAGQRQRLALSRLMLQDASVWILDEPLAALDASGKRLLETLLIEHAAGGGLAVVSTHQALALPDPILRQFHLAAAP